jgi:methyl coenzyme M reductase gamma subunit
MKWEGIDRRKNGAGRRAIDHRECPFHKSHEGQIRGLIVDMKTKIGLRAAAILVSVFLATGGILFVAINKYVETATTGAVELLKVHIEKSENHMIDIGEQLDELNSSNRIIIYRLNKIDKTPEYPGRPGPNF